MTSGTPALAGSAGVSWQAVSAADGTPRAAIQSDGHARCWGDSTASASSATTPRRQHAPGPVAHDDATWTTITGARTARVRDARRRLAVVLGLNTSGELAADTGPDTFRSTPVTASVAGPWLSVVGGARHTCAIDAQHQLWCAGLDSGALGAPGGGSRRTPVLVGSGAVQLAIGGEPGTFAGTACMIDGAGALSCWGDNAAGAVGDGTGLDQRSPVAIRRDLVWAHVAVGDHTCALDDAGEPWCWGADSQGQTGNAALVTDVPVPTMAAGGMTFQAIAASRHSCAIDGSLHASCWGDDSVGQGGVAVLMPPMFLTMPTAIDDTVATWHAIATGASHTCGLDGSGQVLCWGDNSVQQLGDGTPGGSDQPTPVVIAPGSYDSLTVGADHACAGQAGVYQCWGYNQFGQLGDQSLITPSTAIALDGTWIDVSAGASHTCGVASDGSLACWGWNLYGQLGDGTTIDHHEPKAVGSDHDWRSVAAGLANTCAIKLSGDAYCWGRDTEGEIGDGTGWRTTLVVVP